MIKHIVFFKSKENHSKADMDEMVSRFQALPKTIPFAKNFSIGMDISHRGTYDMALSCDFETEDELKAYGVHPDHRGIVTELVPKVCEDRREVIDYQY